MDNRMMQDSGVEWIGEIPQDWKIDSLKRLLQEPLKYGANEAAELDDKTLPRYIRITDFNDDGLLKDSSFKSLPIDKAQGYYLENGDVLFARSGATVGKTFIFYGENKSACFAGYLIKASTNRHLLSPEYLYFYTKSPLYEMWKNFIFTQATIQNIGADKYAYLPVVVPPILEQQAIADYLDNRCGKLDAIIALKQQQIAKLDALRQSIIYQAVTKGLNPSAPLVDSGVEWLGEIPKEWKVDSLKRLLDEPLKYGANEAAELDDKNLPRYIRITDFDLDGKLKEDTFKSLPIEKAEDYYLKNGDVLFARSGATVGKTFIFYGENESACFAGYLIKASTSKHLLLPEYLYFYTKSPAYEMWKNFIFTQATIQNIGADKYAYLPIIVPPISEQQAIVAYLDEETSRINRLKENLNQQIETLQAYKKSLIYEVVTGKKRLNLSKDL